MPDPLSTASAQDKSGRSGGAQNSGAADRGPSGDDPSGDDPSGEDPSGDDPSGDGTTSYASAASGATPGGRPTDSGIRRARDASASRGAGGSDPALDALTIGASQPDPCHPAATRRGWSWVGFRRHSPDSP